jgi:hypothetical protein
MQTTIELRGLTLPHYICKRAMLCITAKSAVKAAVGQEARAPGDRQ